jgi:hypothetical protein
LVPLYQSGQHADLASRLKAVIAGNPQYPMLVYNLACRENLSGRTSDAIDHLRQAVEAAESSAPTPGPTRTSTRSATNPPSRR